MNNNPYCNAKKMIDEAAEIIDKALSELREAWWLELDGAITEETIQFYGRLEEARSQLDLSDYPNMKIAMEQINYP